MLERGRAAEDLVADFLVRHGLTILARNYRCRRGEIDLVVREGGTCVFVEVRLRRSDRYGGAGGSIDRRKQARLIAAARHWLAGKPDQPCRFDAVLLEDLDVSRLEWIRDAFPGE